MGRAKPMTRRAILIKSLQSATISYIIKSKVVGGFLPKAGLFGDLLLNASKDVPLCSIYILVDERRLVEFRISAGQPERRRFVDVGEGLGVGPLCRNDLDSGRCLASPVRLPELFKLIDGNVCLGALRLHAPGE